VVVAVRVIIVAVKLVVLVVRVLVAMAQVHKILMRRELMRKLVQDLVVVVHVVTVEHPKVVKAVQELSSLNGHK
jgi:hypothetical protein